MTVRAALVSLLVSMLVLGGAVSYFGTVSDGIGLDSFRSRAAFHAHLAALQQADASAAGGFLLGGSFNDVTTAAEALDAGGFSGTNVQVAGVDEADILKTDGELIYLASGGEVVLIRAHPPASMGVVSRISGEAIVGDREGEVHVLGLYLHEGILVVISSLYAGLDAPHMQPAVDYLMPMAEGRTLVSLFSTVDPAEPTRLHVFEFTGVYSASRLKGTVVYLVLQQAVSVQDDEASYPMVCMDRRCVPYDASRIYYDPEASGAGSLTNVVAIDVETKAVGYLSLLTGYTSTVYMSPGSLYVTFAKWGPLGQAFPIPDLVVQQTGFTSIYRIAVAGTDLSPTAGGNVEGWLLNQFSMDEHRSYLRVATTTGWGDPVNNV
ncbi:MAG: beta-propeller domain-containing protein, partial [Candidatus Thermoplasmatota archaeon]|nr:beta-propeller domain-containing protein [Candidatus Thermoplasmatota archaeon]